MGVLEEKIMEAVTMISDGSAGGSSKLGMLLGYVTRALMP